MFRTKFWVSFLLAISWLSVSAQPFPDSPEPWREAYNFDLEDFTFTHPMTVISSEDLEAVKTRISFAFQPQKAAFDQLLFEASGFLEFVPEAPSTLNIPGGYEDSEGLESARETLWSHCHPAYSSALAYSITENVDYAEKSVQILMNWATVATTFTGADRGLQLGSYFSPMLYAADLLHDYEGWSEEDRMIFKAWWRAEVLENGDVIRVMRQKDNNWKDAALLGVFSASVVLEDVNLLHEALIQLKSYFYTRTDANVRLPGDSWKIANDENGIYLPREVVRNDGRSGLTYTAYALTTMVQCLEIARYAGFNFWEKETEHGVGIGDVINQYYVWDVNTGDFPWNSTPNRTTKRRNHYELANSRLEINAGILQLLSEARPVLGREGDAYVTLTKGDMRGLDQVVAASPTVSLEVLSSRQLALSWVDNSNNEFGYVIQRNSADKYVTIGAVKNDETYYLDNTVIGNQTYTYRVGAYNASQDTSFSEVIEVTTPQDPTMPPEAPVLIEGFDITTNSITLNWTNVALEEGYKLERSSGGEFVEVSVLGVNDTVYVDNGLERSKEYIYRVSAFNGLGNSDGSNTLKIITLSVGQLFISTDGIMVAEAENGDYGTSWQTTSLLQASGTVVLEVNPELNNAGDEPECLDDSCLSLYYLQINESGNYRFWFRIFGNSGEDDSFFWRINDGDWIRENGRFGNGVWHETDDPQVNSLAQGIHTLQIAYRENGTQLDKFVIQLDSKSIPEGDGPVESPRGDLDVPNVPDNVVVTLEDSTQARISWSDTQVESGYKLERKTADEFEELAQLDVNTTFFLDQKLASNTKYTYRILAFNQLGNSNYSAPIDITTPEEFVPVALGMESYSSGINIYPVPSSGLITIEFPQHPSLLATVTVRDLGGRTYFQQSSIKGYEFKVDLPAGFYIVHLQRGSMDEKRKIIIL